MDNEEIKNVDVEKMQQENSEAYLNALRQLDKEKKTAKKAKRKKFFIVLVAIIGAYILVMNSLPIISANLSVSIIKKAVRAPEKMSQTLETVVDEYINEDLHSEEKEIKNLYKIGKLAVKKENFAAAGYLFNLCIEYSSDYKDKILKEFSYENMDQMFSKGAKEALESGDYKTAVTLYDLCEDQESIAAEAKEAKYNLGISYIDSKEYDLASSLLNKIKGYRYSNALLVWLEVQKAEDYDSPLLARNELKARLKNPSSYQEVSAKAWASTNVYEGNGEAYIEVTRYAIIVYSATNGFGARLQDTYTWNNDDWIISGNGLTYDELKEIVKTYKPQIIEKAKSAK